MTGVDPTCPICDGPMVTGDTVFYVRPERVAELEIAEAGLPPSRSPGVPPWLRASRPLACSRKCARTVAKALAEYCEGAA